MRSRSLARVVIARLGVSVVITLGCGKPPTGPSEQPPPPPPQFDTRTLSAQQLTAFALYRSAGLHEGLTPSALTSAAEEGKVLSWPLRFWTRSNAGVPRWRFVSDCRSVLANRQPHV